MTEHQRILEELRHRPNVTFADECEWPEPDATERFTQWVSRKAGIALFCAVSAAILIAAAVMAAVWVADPTIEISEEGSTR